MKRKFLPAFLLLLMLSTATLYAADDVLEIFLYNDEVLGEINLGRYLQTGEVCLPNGEPHAAEPARVGPAPPPYPEVYVWEPGIERLGQKQALLDGIKFRQKWETNKKVLVVWKIEIPDALDRYQSEFDKDLTVSLWVDWNQDEMWGKNEKMVQDHINLAGYLPTNKQKIHVNYITTFTCPDIEDFMWSEGMSQKPVKYNLWVRGSLAYDDPDVSPDEEQLFGDVEDYLVKYRDKEKKGYQDREMRPE
jgi:hypothetical protein